MFRRAFAIWGAMAVVAVFNGMLREAVLVPRFGPAAAHVASTLLLAAALSGLTFLSIDWIAPFDGRSAAAVGAFWVALTLAFEFAFGRLVAGKAWSELLADYDLFRGRIWILVPLTLALAPAAALRWRRRRGRPS